jgi:Chaperone of endosialidase
MPRRLQPYSIFTNALSRRAVAHENLGENAVQNVNIDTGAISNDNMQIDSINAYNIQAHSITAEEIMAGTITADEIAVRSLTAELIQVGSLTATEIMANTITGDEITANVKLEAPLVYGGGMRAYDIVNPDPSEYIGTVPSLPYVSIAARTYPGGVNTAQVTCYDNGYVNIFAGAIQQVYINGGSGNPPSGWNSDNIIATRGWVNNNYSGTSHGHGTHVHGGVTAGGSNTSSASVSDERLKKDIEPLDVGLNFIETLNPVKFKFINGDGSYLQDAHGMTMIEDGEEPEVVFRDGVRTHYGLIAQQVKAASDTITEDDFAGWVHTEDDVQMLRYDEFIAPLIKAVQELSEQNRELREEIKSLWAKVR